MDLTITFHKDVNDAYEELRQKKILYAVFKTNEEKTELILETLGGKLEDLAEGEKVPTFEDFKNAMPKDEPRWAIYYLHFLKDDGAYANKLVFFHYSPDSYFGPLKFFVASAKDSVIANFVGINKTIQVNDWVDLDEEEMIALFK